MADPGASLQDILNDIIAESEAAEANIIANTFQSRLIDSPVLEPSEYDTAAEEISTGDDGAT